MVSNTQHLSLRSPLAPARPCEIIRDSGDSIRDSHQRFPSEILIRDSGVVSIAGSDDDLIGLGPAGGSVAAGLRGETKVSGWMLWPADFAADWDSEKYGGYVERRALFNTMRQVEAVSDPAETH